MPLGTWHPKCTLWGSHSAATAHLNAPFQQKHVLESSLGKYECGEQDRKEKQMLLKEFRKLIWLLLEKENTARKSWVTPSKHWREKVF